METGTSTARGWGGETRPHRIAGAFLAGVLWLLASPRRWAG